MKRAKAGSGPGIRPATPGDTEFILSLAPRFVAFDLPPARRKRSVTAAIRADLERTLRDAPPGDQFFVSEDSRGQHTGFLHLQVQRDFFSGARDCHISDLAVAQVHEGEGYGRALLDFASQWARRHRCRQLSLSVFPGNARARSLYVHAGFHSDLLRLTKPLDPTRPQARAKCAPRPRTPGVAKRKPLK